MKRLPIRLKLTLAFAGVMAVVLALTGLVVYFRLEDELDTTVNQGLRSRAGDVSALVEGANSTLDKGGRRPLTEREDSFAQILSPQGKVIDATGGLRREALLTTSQLRRASRGTITVERPSTIEPDVPTRLLATPVDARGRRLIVVVGAALDDNDEALAGLAKLLAIGGPIALMLASLAGYGVAAAALRPVEAMRRKAAEISEHAPGERLPVAASGDELARLGATLNAMLDRLDAAFERERTFVADASHELRTPLAILRTELELALRRGRSVEELEDALRSASEETDRLAQLAEDLLVIARSDGGRLPIRATAVDPGELLANLQRRFGARVERAGRELAVQTPAEPFALSADPLRLEQALGNLIDNAIRHGASGITLSAKAGAEGAVELHVRDDGTGFPPDLLPDAFERFTRGDHARGRGGTGLGLAIAQTIARAHGGEAYAANHPDGGAEVWIELPATR